jgi:hypothetical protein
VQQINALNGGDPWEENAEDLLRLMMLRFRWSGGGGAREQA